MPLWNWARVRGEAREAQEKGQWSWALMGPPWAPF